MLRNQLQAFGKVLLHQLIALLQRLSVFPEDRLAVFMVRNDFAAVGFKVIGSMRRSPQSRRVPA